MASHDTAYEIRCAEARDLPVLARFEAEIARISFGDDAVDSLDVQEKKLRKAMDRSSEGMLVACDPEDRPIGWLWITMNVNPMTGSPYANFRSLAVDDVPQRSEAGEMLLGAGVALAEERGARTVVGRVHSANTATRILYRKFGFDVSYLTMRLDPGRRPGVTPS